VRTLRNAVEQGKVHHAYLFVGSRGTGKTSMAKILAACLNCERGPTIEPCGVCDSCVAIASATSLDVIEMDAASNNSVEDVRELRERVAYAPVSGRHKVYILDEAHMLSSQAWNAFLKTLEEPPPNTIFVLATTEAQKVLPTVVDRCHRFDFQRPGMPEIAGVLRRVCAAEGIEAPDEALALIARAATGSFRDALGTLEQLVTYAGPSIAQPDVLAVLGVADVELLLAAVDAVAAHDARAALLTVERLAASGRDLGQFYRDLEAHLRALLVVQTLGEVPETLRLTAEHDARVADQAGRVGSAEVVRLLDALAAALGAVKDGADQRIQLELALAKAAAPRIDHSMRALLARIERLEGRGGVAEAPSARPEAPTPTPTPPERPAPPSHDAPAGAAGTGEAPASTPFPRHEAAREAAAATAAAPVEAIAAQVPAPVEAIAEPAAAPAAQAIAEPTPVADAAAALDPDLVRDVWPAVLDQVGAANAMLGALLRDARIVAASGETLTLGFAASASFLKKKAESRESQELIASAVASVTGARPRLAFELRDDLDPAGATGAAAESLTPDEWVERFVSEFSAEEIVPHEEGSE